MLKLGDWITSSNKYPDRAKSPELNETVKNNAQNLLNAVNGLLNSLGIDLAKVKVSSGFRPSSINKKIPNAAKRSLHQAGLAIDIVDNKNEIGKLILANHDLLRVYGLWLEDLAHTPTWAHLDLGTRSNRAIRVFKP